MKHLSLLLAILPLLVAYPAFAYSPPGQGTDNATDIILWHGDNVTIESANLTGTVEVSGLNDTLDDIAADYLAFIVVAFFLVLVFMKQSIILDALGVPVTFVYGLTLASGETVYSTLWVAGLAIAIIGLYLLYKIAASIAEKRRGEE